MSFGAPEILIVLAIVLLLFGAKKLPELARGLGQAQKEFKQGSREGFKAEDDPDAAPKPAEPKATDSPT